MEITSEMKGATVLLRVIGKITGQYSVQLTRILTRLKTGKFENIVLDLSNVDFIDSPGLGALVYTQLLLNKVNKKIILSSLHEDIKYLFEDFALNKHFQIVSSYELN